MPDPVNEMKEAVVRAVRREIQRDASERGVNLGAQDTAGRNTLGAFSGVGQTAQFGTGYDTGSGLTTMGFVFDFSLFDSDDILT